MSRSTNEATTAMAPRTTPPVAIPRRSPPGDSRCESPRAIAAAPGPNGRPVQNAAPTITAAMPRMRALRLARAPPIARSRGTSQTTRPASTARSMRIATVIPITSPVLPGSHPTGMPISRRTAATSATLRSRSATAGAAVWSGELASGVAEGFVMTHLYIRFAPFGESPLRHSKNLARRPAPLLESRADSHPAREPPLYPPIRRPRSGPFQADEGHEEDGRGCAGHGQPGSADGRAGAGDGSRSAGGRPAADGRDAAGVRPG